MKKVVIFVTILFWGTVLISAKGYANPMMPPSTHLELFGNYSTPNGDDYGSSFSGGIKVGKAVPFFAGWDVTLSNIKFDRKNKSDNLSIKYLTLNIFAVPMQLTKSLYPFFSFGAGHYIHSKGSDGAGVNAAVGLFIPIDKQKLPLVLDISADYHHIFNDSNGTSFIEGRAGLDIYF